MAIHNLWVSLMCTSPAEVVKDLLLTSSNINGIYRTDMPNVIDHHILNICLGFKVEYLAKLSTCGLISLSLVTTEAIRRLFNAALTLNAIDGSAVAQGVSCRLLTSAARVRAWNWVRFLRVLRFPLPLIHSTNFSTIIAIYYWGVINGTLNGCSNSGLTPLQHIYLNKCNICEAD
jgi:hypothetical protein